MIAKNLFTNKLMKTLKSLLSQKKESLPSSETKEQEEPQESILCSLTTTLSAPRLGLPQSLRYLKKEPIVQECQALLSSLKDTDVTGTFFLSSSLSSYTISGFVEDNEICLVISQSQERGQRGHAMNDVIMMAQSIFSKPVIALIVLTFLINLVVLMIVISE